MQSPCGIARNQVAHWTALCFHCCVAHVNVLSLKTMGLNQLSSRHEEAMNHENKFKAEIQKIMHTTGS